jgi:hypothetical protein
MAEVGEMDEEARRLLKVFAGSLDRNRSDPLDWQRFYDFVIYVSRHAPASAETVGHALVQEGLDWDHVEPYALFCKHGVELLRRAGETPSRGAMAPKKAAKARLSKKPVSKERLKRRASSRARRPTENKEA